ncbi:AEC family transporter [Massilia glaciei]|nr:AEC family transporter [Massilia glaciei]
MRLSQKNERGFSLLLALLLPLFLIAGLGWALARSSWLARGWPNGVSELTVKLLVPALLLNGAYTNGISASISWQLLCAFYLPLVAVFLLYAHGWRRGAGAAPRALAATYSNNAFVGIPVLVQTVGNDSLRYAFPIIAFHSLVGFSLYYLCARGDAGAHRGRGGKLGASLLAALKNPIVASLFIGFALNLGGVDLPAPVRQLLAMLAGAALPCALLALGASLATLAPQRGGETVLVAATKLLLLPLLVWLLARHGFGLAPEAVKVLVLLSACPVGINAALVVKADGKDAGMVGSAILLSSILCMATIPLWLWFLH